MEKLIIEVPERTMERLKLMATERNLTIKIIAGVAVDMEAENYFLGKEGDPK